MVRGQIFFGGWTLSLGEVNTNRLGFGHVVRSQSSIANRNSPHPHHLNLAPRVSACELNERSVGISIDFANMSLPHTTRSSIYQANNNNKMASNTGTTAAGSMAATNRQRQYAHLNAQLAQLNAHLADMENLLRMTAVQAEYVRGLGGWMGGL